LYTFGQYLFFYRYTYRGREENNNEKSRMIKILLVLVAVVAWGRYDMEDVTAYIKKEGAGMLAHIEDIPAVKSVESKIAEPDRKTGSYRLKASQRS
jgi:hypothetical protein